MNISEKLIQWYLKNARPLPWRNDPTPYNIWVSEVILQQTQMSRGVEYYNRFKEKFSDIYLLAQAEEQEVLHVWQGLGYYGRARNMLHCAKQVVDEFGGVFPDNYYQLVKLKGIGDYTACAILSIAYNKPCIVVDGNVRRFIARLYAIDQPVDKDTTVKLIKSIGLKLLKQNSPSLFNQALMEFGALICAPVIPLCNDCVLTKACKAFQLNIQKDLPVKIKKQVRKKKYYHYVMFYDDTMNTLIQQRNNDSVWQNLWEFPMIETNLDTVLQKKDFETSFSFISNLKHHPQFLASKKHVLTHLEIHAKIYAIAIKSMKSASDNYKIVNYHHISKFPVHNLMKWCYEQCKKFIDNL